MRWRATGAGIVGGLLAWAMTGCAAVAGGGGGAHLSESSCSYGGGQGACTLSLKLTGTSAFDYTVSQKFLPAHDDGGVRADVYIRTSGSAVRVWIQDSAGQQTSAVIQPGSPQWLRGTADVGRKGDEQAFVVWFQLSDGAKATVDATVSYE